MAETADDLSTPLGQKTLRAKHRFRLPFTFTQALAVLLGLFLVVFAGFAIFNDNRAGAQRIANIALGKAPQPGENPAAALPSASEPVIKSAIQQAAPGEH